MKIYIILAFSNDFDTFTALTNKAWIVGAYESERFAVQDLSRWQKRHPDAVGIIQSVSLIK